MTSALEVRPLIDSALAGDVRAAARLMSAMESDARAAEQVVKSIFSKTGRAQVIGITGPPGAGKSTLVSDMAGRYREQARTVGIVAVDPSGPFSGGALLGDRIRMQERFSDREVFIRSMGSRGHGGGLASATSSVVALLDAMGKDVIVVETVGVGQDALDVLRVADTIVLVLAPGMGDSVQAMKSGLLEAADIIAVNKADRPGADETVRDLQAALGAVDRQAEWSVPVVSLAAIQGQGVEELIREADEHFRRGREGGDHRRRAAAAEIERIIREKLLAELAELRPHIQADSRLVATRDTDPYTAAERLLEKHAHKRK